MNTLAQRIHPPSVGRFLATFGYAWLMIGLFTGTLVLVVAVRGIIDLIQRFGWPQSAQDKVLMGVIGIFIICSFLLARKVVRSLYRQPPRTRRIALGALALPALASAYAWSDPARFLARFAGAASSAVKLQGGPSFIFGAYPDEDGLRELRRRGVTTVVSLQDPRVLVELEGIKAEKAATERLGLAFVQAPMLPWVSDNTASLNRIRMIALHGRGIYYVHCGLGRDRTNIAKRVIASVALQRNASFAARDLKNAVTFADRNDPFQRGRSLELSNDVWVVPMLNEQEFYGYIVQGQPGHVFLALNAADSTQAAFAARAQVDMRQYVVDYSALSTSAGDTGRAVKPADRKPAALAAVVSQVRAEKPPYTVMVHYTAFEERVHSPLVRALLKAYGLPESGKPAPSRVPLLHRPIARERTLQSPTLERARVETEPRR